MALRPVSQVHVLTTMFVADIKPSKVPEGQIFLDSHPGGQITIAVQSKHDQLLGPFGKLPRATTCKVTAAAIPANNNT